MTAYKLEVFTPYRLFYSGDVEAITLKLSDGEAGIYAFHSRFTAPLKTCALRIKEAPKKGGAQAQWRAAFITNGIVEVKRHKVVVLADAAEWPEEIDRDRALAAKKDAEEILASSSFKFEHNAAREKLARAETRLKILENALPS